MIEGRDLAGSNKKLRYGMVGGSAGSFIAGVHRMAIAMTNSAELAAGCFSRDLEKSKATGNELGVDSSRIYKTYAEMAEKEGSREDGIDFVVIATPNDTHYDASKTFLLNGINVSCDKPLCFTVEQAEELAKLAKEKALKFMVTYVYTGYPMVREARDIIRRGELGEIRLALGEYPQDWLADKVEDMGSKQALWRTDPKFAGVSCCVGDIGTHVENMLSFVSGLEIQELSATLNTFVKGRPLDDNAFISLKYKGGAQGTFWSSQVAIGRENGLKFRIYGTDGGLEWEQENPNVLKFARKGQPVQILTRGNGYLSDAAKRWTRMPSGHPEGLFEAWATLYESFCNTLKGDPTEFPTVDDGLRGVKFVHACVNSSKKNSEWVEV